MIIDILTLFPEMFSGFLSESLLKKAIDKQIIAVNLHDFRKFTKNKHKKVDDYPYGGGPGMVLQVEPIYACLKKIKGSEDAVKILLCPQGEQYNQKRAEKLSGFNHLIIICGHYEGYDERIRSLVDLELSIGDYVLTGGEIASMVVVDSVSRLIDGVLNKNSSHQDDSFSTGLLEGPQYTRPAEFMELKVPDVLLSGNHQNIRKYRKYQSLKRTYERRPELLKNLDEEAKIILENIKKDC